MLIRYKYCYSGVVGINSGGIVEVELGVDKVHLLPTYLTGLLQIIVILM